MFVNCDFLSGTHSVIRNLLNVTVTIKVKPFDHFTLVMKLLQF